MADRLGRLARRLRARLGLAPQPGPSAAERALVRAVDDAKVLAASALVLQMRARGPLERLADAELKVFSQFGDDGIIQYLIAQTEVAAEVFVELGVERYTEANTRFLLIHDNWTGLVVDGHPQHVEAILRDPVSWRHDLVARCAFIDRDNVDQVLTEAGFSGPIGLLSLDIDGNDYWVWERLEAVEPTIVVVEYNSLFGWQRPVTVPYDPAFSRAAAHASNLYWGSSLAALARLAVAKGYAFVGCNSAGNNAYFVRRDRLGAVRPVTLEEGFVLAKFRESRDADGRLSFLRGAARQAAIGDQPLVDVATGERLRVADLE